MNFLLLFACLFLLCGCRQAFVEAYPIKTMEVAIDENSIIKFSDIYESVRFVRLETSDDYLVGHIDKLIATDDKYIILDRTVANMIFVFNSDGSFSNRIGSIGRGPNEFDEPSDMAYDAHDDELLVLCHNLKAIYRFKLDGTFVGKTEMDWWVNSIYVVGEDACLLYFNNRIQPNKKKSSFNIVIINKEGAKLKELLPFNKNYGELSPPKPNFSSFQKEVLLTPYYFSKTYKLKDNIIEAKYSLDFKQHRIPEALLKNITDKELDIIIRDNDYAFLIALHETDTHIIGQYVYRQVVYDFFYSKEIETMKSSSIYFNDMYALLSGQSFRCLKGDSLISSIEPQFINYYKDLMGSISSNNDIKDVLYNQYIRLPNTKMKDNIMKIIKSTDFMITDAEIDFINSIDETDNQILMIAKLRNF